MENGIERYAVGQKNEKWKQHDGFLIEYGNSNGFVLYVFLSKPTAAEKAAVIESDLPEVGFSVKNGIGLFTFRFGAMLGEAAYYPGLYKDMKAEMDVRNPLHILVFLIDGSIGELQGIRLIGMGRDFSRSVAVWCNEVCNGKTKLMKSIYEKRVMEFEKEEIEKHHREATAKRNYKDSKDEERAAEAALCERSE